MKASDLKETLNLCKESLLSADFIPILTHFCFARTSVHAWNGTTAVEAKLDSGLSLALHGETLLGLLDTFAPTRELSITQRDEKKGTVVLSYGRSTMELASLPKADFQFKTPVFVPIVSIPFTDKVATALIYVLETFKDDAMRKDLAGVVFSVSRGQIDFYSSNVAALTRTTVKDASIKVNDKLTLFVPGGLCSQALTIFRIKGSDSTLQLNKDWVQVAFSDVVVFSKLQPDAPADMENTLTKALPTEKNAWTVKPKRLTEALQRATVLFSKVNVTDRLCTISIEGSTMKITASGDRGKLDEVLKLDSPLPSLTVNIEPTEVIRALENGDSIAVTSRCLAVKGDGYVRLVSTSSK